MNANYHLYKNHNFKSLQYRDYSIRLEEIKGTMNVRENDTDSHVKYNYSINYNDFNEILYSEKNVEKLKNVWIQWFDELENQNKKTKYDFVQQLSILDLEAEQNGIKYL
mgnify:CR=1 FL=1